MDTNSHISLFSCPVFYANLTPKIKERFSIVYLNIKIHTNCSIFRSIFTASESQTILKAVNGLFFMGITATKREKWAYNYKYDPEAGLIRIIVADFDFYGSLLKSQV